MEINKIITKLKKFDCEVIRNKKMKPYPKDIDIFITKKNLKKACKYLTNNKFVMFKKQKGKVSFIKYINEEFYILELEYDTKYIFNYFKSLNIKKEKQKHFFENSNKNELKALRYFFMLRNDKKYVNHVIKHWDDLRNKNFIYLLNQEPFIKYPEAKEIDKLMKRRKKYLIKSLGTNFLIYYIYKRLKEKIKRFNSGKIVSLIGVDGVGKTTIANNLKRLKYDSVYFGNVRYPNDDSRFIIYKIFKRYFYNWKKYLKCYILKLKGNVIITDRYPKFFYYDKKGKDKKIHFILYNLLFPNSDEHILLTANIETILKRKNENERTKIEKMKTLLENNFKKNKKNIIINENKEETINKILKIIYE